MTIGTIIIFIIVLAVLIFVHELGHFLAARMSGIRVDAFKIGFGPKALSWKRGETEYGVNWIPFGGFVKIFGENPDEENTSGPDSGRSFVHKPRWKQAIVLFAGVFMNFLFAWLLYTIIFTSGVTASPYGFEQYAGRFQNPRIMITSILPGSPAEKAGLKEGDVIRLVVPPGADPAARSSTAPQSTEDIQAVIDLSHGQPVMIEYSRGVSQTSAEIASIQGLVSGKYAIGIAMDKVVDLKLPVLAAIGKGFTYTLTLIKETVIGLYTFIANIFVGHPDFADVAGPVGIAGIVGNAASMGLTYLLMVTAIISINLGVVNLIPFPALDGGRILFVALEGIFRRRIPAGFANTVNAVGFGLLMLLMIAVTWKDVAKLVK